VGCDPRRLTLGPVGDGQSDQETAVLVAAVLAAVVLYLEDGEQGPERAAPSAWARAGRLAAVAPYDRKARAGRWE
jgi:hypothetical protein